MIKQILRTKSVGKILLLLKCCIYYSGAYNPMNLNVWLASFLSFEVIYFVISVKLVGHNFLSIIHLAFF